MMMRRRMMMSRPSGPRTVIWEWDAADGHISEFGQEGTGSGNTLSYSSDGMFLKSVKSSNANIGFTIDNSVRSLFSGCSSILIEYSFKDVNLTGVYQSNVGGSTSVVFYFLNPWETGINRMDWRVVNQSTMAYRTTGSGYTQFNASFGTSGKIGIYYDTSHLYQVFLNDSLLYTQSNAYRSGSASRTDMVRASSNNASTNPCSIVITHLKITGQ